MSASFETAQRCVDNILRDLMILSGEILGSSDSTVRDVEGTLLVNLKVLAEYVREPGMIKVYPEVKDKKELV